MNEIAGSYSDCAASHSHIGGWGAQLVHILISTWLCLHVCVSHCGVWVVFLKGDYFCLFSFLFKDREIDMDRQRSSSRWVILSVLSVLGLAGPDWSWGLGTEDSLGGIRPSFLSPRCCLQGVQHETGCEHLSRESQASAQYPVKLIYLAFDCVSLFRFYTGWCENLCIHRELFMCCLVSLIHFSKWNVEIYQRSPGFSFWCFSCYM